MNLQPFKSLRRSRRACGFSLVELLIAITIGLFILWGLTVVFVNLKQAFTAQDQLAHLQDSERLALTILTTTLQSAAYFPDPKKNTRERLLPATKKFAAEQGVVGTVNSLSVRYARMNADGLMDCLGTTNKVTGEAVVINTFTVNGGDLLCSIRDDGSDPTALVGNIDSMEVLYGTDTAGHGNTDRYLRAEEIEASHQWLSVRTARITLKFKNPYASQPGQPKTVNWTQVINLMNKS